MKHICLFLIALFVSSCALPSSPNTPESFVSDFERDVDAMYREGLFASQRGRYVDAEFAFRKVLLVVPTNSQARLNLAVALEQQEVFDEAEQIYRDILGENSKNLRARAGLARHFSTLEQYEDAVREYDGIRELAVDAAEAAGAQADPGYLQAAAASLRSVAAIRYRLGDEEAATCLSEEAQKITPGNVDEKLRHTRLLISRGLLDQARDFLGDVDVLAGPEPLLHQHALLLYEEAKASDAEQVCSQLLLRSNLSPNTERDCLWLVALSSGYTVVNPEEEELSDEAEVKGFELAFRDFSESDESLFIPYQLAKDISSVQSEFLAAEDDLQPSLMAIPSEL